MFKIFRITFPSPFVNTLIDPIVESLGEYSEFNTALADAKPLCQLIDFAPAIVVKNMTINELTDISPWDGRTCNIQGECYSIDVIELNSAGKLI